MNAWSIADIPAQNGKLAMVTGATGGLGFHTALELARAGCDVIVSGRNEDKGRLAVQKIRSLLPYGKIGFEKVDLASQASVKTFCRRLSDQRQALDILVNNAGVMALKKRQISEDGFEMQLATNYLGHFALTAGLLPLLRAAQQPRVVNLSSLAHRRGKIHFEDLQLERGYGPWKSYSQTKLAMLMFGFELQRRSDRHGWGLLSASAHPGWSNTDLIANGQGKGLLWRLSQLFAPLWSQSAAQGALPSLYAATAPEAERGGYYGPRGIFEMKGPPGHSFIAKQARDTGAAARLWEVSQALTGPFDS